MRETHTARCYSITKWSWGDCWWTNEVVLQWRMVYAWVIWTPYCPQTDVMIEWFNSDDASYGTWGVWASYIASVGTRSQSHADTRLCHNQCTCTMDNWKTYWCQMASSLTGHFILISEDDKQAYSNANQYFPLMESHAYYIACTHISKMQQFTYSHIWFPTHISFSTTYLWVVLVINCLFLRLAILRFHCRKLDISNFLITSVSQNKVRVFSILAPLWGFIDLLRCVVACPAQGCPDNSCHLATRSYRGTSLFQLVWRSLPQSYFLRSTSQINSNLG